MSMMDILLDWRRAGLIRELDIQFAGFIGRIAGNNADQYLLLGAALASHAVSAGNICLDLEAIAGQAGKQDWRPAAQPEAYDEADDRENAFANPGETMSVALPACNDWIQTLESSTACVMVACPAAGDAAAAPLPLVLDKQHKRLYMRRYWHYEQRLAIGLKSLAGGRTDNKLDENIGRKIKEYFPDDGTPGPERQRMAAFIGLRQKLAIITGGPGTGKTHIVARLLALMLEQKPDVVIRIAAPTGKAAKRIMESIRAAVGSLDINDDLKARLPSDAATLHRLLGAMGEGIRFRHGPANPVEADVVVVDEASMIDLPMAAKLLDALRDDTRLILLGDMHQLASVEPGNVFGDICSAVPSGAFSNAMIEDCQGIGLTCGGQDIEGNGNGGLGDCLVRLAHSYRFKPESGIAQLSKNIVQGLAEEALTIIKKQDNDSLTWVHTGLEDDKKKGKILDDICQNYKNAYAEICNEMKALGEVGQAGSDQAPEALKNKLDKVFKLYARQRILCALRGGPFGIRKINARIDELLGGRREWYPGRPIIITRNNYSLNLFNGDIGITGMTKDGRVRAWFEPATGGGQFRPFATQLLPDFEVAHALTVHKSQGSEFEEVILVLPAQTSPVLTRELLYTGVTRAMSKATLVGSEQIIRETVAKPAARASGLAQALTAG